MKKVIKSSMKRVIKFFAWFVAILVVLLIALYFTLDFWIKTGIEKVVPQITGTPVTVSSVSVSPFQGKATIKGLDIQNPKGFTTPSAFKLGEISVHVDINTVLSDTIVVKSVKIDGPEAAFELADGKTNISVLQKNIESFTGTPDETKKKETKKAEEKSDKPAKKVIVDDLQFTNGSVRLAAIGKDIKVPLPSIHMKDIGRDKPTTIGQMVAKILDIFSIESLKSFANSGKEMLKSAGKELQNQVEGVKDNLKKGADSLKESGENLKNNIKGFFK